jgi:hypothetical protein
MRALTVRQPWAHMIAHCGKNVENRSRRTSYRGLLAIHAGARSRWDSDGEQSPLVREAWREYGHLAAHLDRESPWIDFGAVIAVADLYGCHMWPAAGSCNGRSRPPCSPWAALDQWHWQLRNVRRLKPVPCRGMLGLWSLPPDVEQAVRAQFIPVSQEKEEPQ